MDKDPKKVAAGKARLEKISPTRRSEIARMGAFARHGRELPKAVAEGILIIGDRRIPCAVLDDKEETRVLTQEGFLTAIGRAGKAKGGEGAGVDGKPAFLRARNLEPFISKELLASTTPIEFIPWRGPGYQGRAFGFRARLLPDVCWVFQDAMIDGKLLPSQRHIGQAAREFLRALTNHAIDDLVDLATGYEDSRKRRAINRIIERYVTQEAQPWVKMFRLEFYREIFRLNDWQFNPESTARPSVIGHWTNDIYDRLAPGVRSVMDERVRRNAKGRPTQKKTQLLTPEEGKPALERLLEGVILLMRMSKDWSEFKFRLDEFYPRFGDNLTLPFQTGVYYLPPPKG